MNKINRIQQVLENCYITAVDLPGAVVLKGKALFNKVSKVALAYFKPIQDQWPAIRKEIAYSFIGQSISGAKNQIVHSFHSLFTRFFTNKANLPSIEMEDLGAKLAQKAANEQKSLQNEAEQALCISNYRLYEEELYAQEVSQRPFIHKFNIDELDDQKAAQALCISKFNINQDELDAEIVSQAFSIWQKNCRLINNQTK